MYPNTHILKNMKWEQDLIEDIRTGTDFDDQDGGIPHPNGYDGRFPEFSDCNRLNLTYYFNKIRDNCNAILEIGVCRNGSSSSTHVFLENKKEDCTYIGIDLEDKSFLNNTDKKIYTIQNTSSDIQGNINKINELGVTQFDFIFIDGWHSINQCYLDWEYTRWLSDFGIVGLHDVSIHPGPSRFIRALNTDLWTTVVNTCPNDWGIGFAWRLNKS
jgi:hypothetical protein